MSLTARPFSVGNSTPGQASRRELRPGGRGKGLAEKRLRRIQSELALGVHQPVSKKLRADFREEYEDQVLSRLAGSSRVSIGAAFDHFERIVKPHRVESITTKTIDEFVAARQTDKGKKAESRVSPATLNKDLRHVKTALKRASEWDYLPKMPKVRQAGTERAAEEGAETGRATGVIGRGAEKMEVGPPGFEPGTKGL